jgi:hypothetical protein
MLGGVCGMFAAMFSLVFGGLLAVFHVPIGTNIVYFEWGGLVFSVIIILLGAMSVWMPRVGVALVASAVLGAACGGVAVAICMAVAAIGGVLVIVASHHQAELKS